MIPFTNDPLRLCPCTVMVEETFMVFALLMLGNYKICQGLVSSPGLCLQSWWSWGVPESEQQKECLPLSQWSSKLCAMKLLSVCSILHTLQRRILHLGHIFPEGDFSSRHASSRGAFGFLGFFLCTPLFFSSKTKFLSRELKGQKQNSDQNNVWQIFTVSFSNVRGMYEVIGSSLIFLAKGQEATRI